MRPSTYSDQAIIAAAQRLQAREPGRRITASAIRTELGGGGLARIKRVWAEHVSESWSDTGAVVGDVTDPAHEVDGVPLSPDDVAVIDALTPEWRVVMAKLYAKAKAVALQDCRRDHAKLLAVLAENRTLKAQLQELQAGSGPSA